MKFPEDVKSLNNSIKSLKVCKVSFCPFRTFLERAIRGALMTPEVQQIHDYAQQLQNYVFGLESKIGKLKLVRAIKFFK